MEIYSTKHYDCIFTGSNYYFYNKWGGLFAIAERHYNIEEDAEHFDLIYGNEHLRESWCRETAKRVINKAEQKYVPKSVIYDSETYEELNKTRYIKVSAELR